MSDDKITITRAEYNNALELAATKSKVNFIAETFIEHEKKEESYLKDIFDTLRAMQKEISEWPYQLKKCSSDLEGEIMAKIREDYMTKKDGELLRRDLANLRVWIVATVGGFTSAGLVIAYVLKLFK